MELSPSRDRHFIHTRPCLRARKRAMPTSNEAAWQQKLAALRAHVAEHGRLPPHSHPSRLGAWVSRQRAAKKAADAGRKGRNKMPPDRAAALEAVPGCAWEEAFEAVWRERLAALQAFVAAHGRLPAQIHPSGLGVWVKDQRTAKGAADAGKKCRNKMPPERAEALEAVPGWTWAVCRKRARAWSAHLQHGLCVNSTSSRSAAHYTQRSF